MADRERQRLWALSARCVACGSCEQACLRRHGVARLRRPSHGQPVAFPEACQHCAYPACVEACIAGALRKDAATERVVLDRERCVGCWSCIMACPYAAVRRDLRSRPISARCDRCDGFRRPACVVSCPTKALRCGGDPALATDMARRGTVVGPLVAAAIYAVLPLVGLWLGFIGPGWAKEHTHELGIAAGSLVAASFLLPMAGRLVWSVIPRAAWARLHLWTGALGVALAMVHALGRFGLNAQTLAAFSLLGLVLTDLSYRYLLPVCLLFEAAFARQAASLPARGFGAPPPNGAHRRVAAADAAARQAQAWARWLHWCAVLLGTFRTVHSAWAIVTTGLVVAHVLIMTVIGAN